MSKEREALKLAREALLPHKSTVLRWYTKVDEALDAIDKVLAQPEQEPVAWIRFDSSGRCRGLLSSDSEDLTESRKAIWQPLYTTPPQRTWVGLTDDEIYSIDWKAEPNYARAIEAKLKEKNT